MLPWRARGAVGAVFRQTIGASLTRYFGEKWPLFVAAALPIIILYLLVYVMAVLGIAALRRSPLNFPLVCLNREHRLPVSPCGHWGHALL
jgi:hypothetical protein